MAGKNGMRRFTRKLRSKSLAYLVRELDKHPVLYKRLNGLRYLAWESMVRVRGFRKGRLPDLNTVYWVDPKRITHGIRERKFDASDRGKVVDGDWDLPEKTIKFEDMDVYQAFYGRFIDHKDWKETAFYQRILNAILKEGDAKWNCVSEAQLNERLVEIDNLYRDIRDNGYKSQEMIRRDSQGSYTGDEIIVSISRDGKMLFCDGRHRLCIAKILGLHKVPVQVALRHPEWVKFRNQLFAQAHSQQTGELYQPLPHPDLTDIPAFYGDERFEIIKKNLLMPTGTLLDIGSYYGYFCHRFEDEGFECYAIEYNPINVFIMEKVRRAENKKFKIFQGSIFDYYERTDFDVVLALNIFHHFLKEKRMYDKLVELLQRLRMKQLFFQPPNYDEPQMQGAYRHYTTDEFVSFILEHSNLNQVNCVGETQDGRHLYEFH